MAWYPALVGTPWIPWRLRTRVDRWVETQASRLAPGLYRWLHFGRVHELLRPVSRGPKHHFFGYYDKSPWSGDGRRLLAHEVDFNDRPPAPGDKALVGLILRSDNDRFQPLAETSAWNWQQGAMAQWHPTDPDRLFFHNDRRDGMHVAVLRSVGGPEICVYERPLYAVAPDGRRGFSVNFARLHHHRPGYGYPGVADPWARDPAPEGDGLFSVDLQWGGSALIVSLAELAAMDPLEDMRGAFHYLNHVQVSPGGKRLAFFHLWSRPGERWRVRLYTSALDGTGLRCVLEGGKVSHYDWRDDSSLLVWAAAPGAGARFQLCDVETGSKRIVGADVLTEDGHCSFSPDRAWVLNDTYPDGYEMRTLMLLRWEDGKRIDLARLYSPKARWWGEIRCDLHPRWSRDGTEVCVDSVHSGERQMYVADVSAYLR